MPPWAESLLAPDAPIVDLRGLCPRGKGPLGIPTSRGYATVARITYDDGDEVSWMLIVKPTLRGDEPVDVVQYHREHPNFPQEPTTEQFFNEPQWESYRRLGQHIAAQLFAAD
jgi:hypothetical protein